MSRKWLIAVPIILVLILLCVLMLAIVLTTVPRLNLADGFHVNLQFGNIQAERTEVYSYTLTNSTTLATLTVDNPCGAAIVTADSENGREIQLSVRKRAYGLNQKAAEAELAKIKVSASQEENTLSLGIQDAEQVCKEIINNSPHIDFTIQVPKNTLVNVKTRLGEASLSGVDTSSAGEPSELRSDFGDVKASQVTGGLKAKTQNGNIAVHDVQAGEQDISLTTSFGDIRLEDSSGAHLDIKTENGTARLDNVKITGDSKIQSSFGDLTWINGKSQSLVIESKNGVVTMRDLDIDKGIKADSEFGDIRLYQVKSTSTSATTLNGKIDIQGASGKIQAKSDFGGISITQAEQVDFDLTSKNGSILFQGSLGNGPHQASSQFGEIRLQLPATAAFNFDLQTSFGAISSDFKVAPAGTPSSTHWVGAVNGGGPLVTAVTQNGDLKLEVK
jgi:Toastrack DUF4097